MALDIGLLDEDGRRDLRLQLQDDAVYAFLSSRFTQVARATGKHLAHYGDARFSGDTLDILDAALADAESAGPSEALPTVRALRALIVEARAAGATFYGRGRMMLVPRVAVAVAIVKGDCVLIGLRRGDHGGGTWALPGGYVEFGESLEDAARREVFEETGLAIDEPTPGPYVNQVFADEGRHSLTVGIVARWTGGEATLCEPDKCAQWLWRRWDDLPEPRFATIDALRRAGFDP